MRFQRMLGARLLCATGVAVGAAGVSSAQPVAYPGVAASPGVQMVVGCPGCAAANQGSYGPALFSPNPKAPFAKGGCEPYCVGRSSYPLSDWAYIRRFCGPTLIPGSCYGHFQTKWRKWEDHCPGGGGAPCAPAVAPCAPPVPCDMPCAPVAPAPITLPPPPADVKSVPGTTTSIPGPAVTPNLPPMEVPPVPVNPPKLPAIPKSISAVIPRPMPMPTELPPLPLPATVGAKESIPVNAETPVPPPPPGEPNRVVVPPLPELPSRK